jgi:hypothetical protein
MKPQRGGSETSMAEVGELCGRSLWTSETPPAGSYLSGVCRVKRVTGGAEGRRY